jgi:hypothetical protein
VLPQIAQGDSNKLWLIPSEFSHALERFQEQFINPTQTRTGKLRSHPSPKTSPDERSGSAVFNSNVQPKRRMKERPTPWHCNCRKQLGPYQLNHAHLKRCPVCGRRPPPRPNRRERAPRTRSAAGRRGQNLAATMIESSRRRGHHDPRSNFTSTRPPHSVHAATNGDPSLQAWENEGGRYATADHPDVPAGLAWHAFSNRYFPGRRRHDLEAIKDYELYRVRRHRTKAPPPAPGRLDSSPKVGFDGESQPSV